MNDSGENIGFAFFILLIIGIIGLNLYSAYGTVRQETFTVTKAERVQSDKSSKYLVFTDKGVFENTDTLLQGKFNSSDLYGSILPGQKYECKVNGFRVQFFSMYPNILECDHRG